jgi:rod shape-determining protein MreD
MRQRVNQVLFNHRSKFILLVNGCFGVLLVFSPFSTTWQWFPKTWLVIELVLLSLIYPRWVGLEAAWLTGLGLDLVFNSLIGEQMLLLTVIIYLTSYFSSSFLKNRLSTGGMMLAGLIMIFQLLWCLMQWYTDSYFKLWILPASGLLALAIWNVLVFLVTNQKIDHEENYL